MAPANLADRLRTRLWAPALPARGRTPVVSRRSCKRRSSQQHPLVRGARCGRYSSWAAVQSLFACSAKRRSCPVSATAAADDKAKTDAWSWQPRPNRPKPIPRRKRPSKPRMLAKPRPITPRLKPVPQQAASAAAGAKAKPVAAHAPPTPSPQRQKRPPPAPTPAPRPPAPDERSAPACDRLNSAGWPRIARC